MKVAIVGSRNFNDYTLLNRVIQENIDIDDIEEIVSGGAIGADRLGERFATINKIEKCIFYPEWNKYGKQAGFLRNIKIVRNSDIVFAFWDGKSKGTEHTINLCKEHNKKVVIQKFKGENMNRVVMIDGNNIAHICFHSAQNIARKHTLEEGEKEKFIEGMTYHLFLNKLISFVKQFKGHYFITWDAARSTEWRKSISGEYKSNRITTDKPQIQVLFKVMNNLRKVLPFLPVYQFMKEGFEADDIIFHCASEAHKYGSEIVIISNDTDLLQVAQRFPWVTQFDPKKNKLMDPPKDYSISVFKALAGDSTDKVVGVKGIGKVTAEKWAQEVYGMRNGKLFKTISELLKENGEKIKQFKNSFELVDIESNPNLMDLEIDLDFLYSEKQFNVEEFKKFLEEYKMNSHLNNLDKTVKLFNKMYTIEV